ncbi:MAG: PorV/PorQ family protein [Rhodothermales bacterium]
MKSKVHATKHFGVGLLLLAACLAVLPARAQNDGGSPDQGTITKVGTTSAQFLKIGIGARPIALGGTFVAEASDLSALYWNPAGLATLNGSSVQLAHTEYLADINYNFAAFGTNLGSLGTLAFSLIYLDSGNMQVRTAQRPEGTGEEFKVQNFALQMSYARALTDRFSIGGSVKYIQERIWHSTASTIAFDVGTLFTTPFQRLRLGASMSNFGPKMRMDGRDILFSEDPNPTIDGNVEIVNAQFTTDRHPLPLLFRVGLAWDAYQTSDHRIMISTDAAHPNDNSEYVNVGAEYSFRGLIALRAGYRHLFEEDGEQNLTFGAGLNLRLDRALRARFDYAYADFGRLDQTHWFTVDLAF